MKAQDYVDAMRRGDFLKALEFRTFIFEKYKDIDNEMAADTLVQLTVFELSQTDINKDDLTVIGFLDSWFQNNIRGIPGDTQYDLATFITGALSALNIKEELATGQVVALDNIVIDSKESLNSFNSEDSAFSILIQTSMRHGLVIGQTMNLNEIVQYIHGMDKIFFENFLNNISTLQELTQSDVDDIPVYGEQSFEVYNKEEHQLLRLWANIALARGDLDMLASMLNRSYDSPEGKRKYLDNPDDKKQLLQAAIDYEQQLVIDELIKYEGLRLTPQQYCDYARIRGFSDQEVEAMSQIFVKLDGVEKKISNLEQRGFDDDAKFTRQLVTIMHQEIKCFLDDTNADKLITNCKDPLEEAESRLNHHRGWAGALGDLFAEMVKGVGSFIKTGKWSPETDSASKVVGVQDALSDFKTKYAALKQSDADMSQDIEDQNKTTNKQSL